VKTALRPDEVILRYVEDGLEDRARELYGDQVVDDWFRSQGWDPDALRAEDVS
jgi:hypothetical protein